jgi:hypothetical protein
MDGTPINADFTRFPIKDPVLKQESLIGSRSCEPDHIHCSRSPLKVRGGVGLACEQSTCVPWLQHSTREPLRATNMKDDCLGNRNPSKWKEYQGNAEAATRSWMEVARREASRAAGPLPSIITNYTWAVSGAQRPAPPAKSTLRQDLEVGASLREAPASVSHARTPHHRPQILRSRGPLSSWCKLACLEITSHRHAGSAAQT